MARWRKDEELPSYRTPAKSALELVDYRQIFDDDADDLGLDDELPPSASAPAVRMANALLINALAKDVSVIHIEPPGISADVRFRTDGAWHHEVSLPADLAPAVGRRLKLMAGLPLHEGEAAVGPLFIQTDERSELYQFLVIVRPAQQGDRLLVRTVSESERARMIWPETAGAMQAEKTLRWEREQLFRLANEAELAVVEEKARAFLSAAEALIPGSNRQVLEARALLAELSHDAGAHERAIAELEEAIALGRTFEAPAMSTSVLIERLADLRDETRDFEGAVETRREAVRLVRQTLHADDPYVSGVLGRLAESLVAADRRAEAEGVYDEAIAILSELTGDDDLELRALVSARSRACAAPAAQPGGE